MKPRARRVTIGAAALVAVLLAVLVVANLGTVRDHVEAWWFQATRKTHAVDPEPTPSLDCARVKGDRFGDQTIFALRSVLGVLTCSGLSVIHDLSLMQADPLSPKSLGVLRECRVTVTWPDPKSFRWTVSSQSVVRTITPELAMRILRANGYRVLEQRFPRRAYVVIRDAEVIADAPIVETFVIPPALSRSEPPLR